MHHTLTPPRVAQVDPSVAQHMAQAGQGGGPNGMPTQQVWLLMQRPSPWRGHERPL